MAKKEKRNRIYTFTIAGLYAAKVEDRHESKPFEMVFKCPESRIEEGPLSLFCKDYAPEFMPKKHPDYVRLVTHEIVKSEADGEPVEDPKLMNRVDLEQYIRDGELPVIVDLYVETDSLRQAVIDCEENQEAFESVQAKMGRKLEEITRKRELAELNAPTILNAPEAPKGKPKAPAGFLS